jgi:WD40 repeat protein
VAHGASVNCLALGHKSGRVLVTGGDDKKVNLWAVGKPNCIMVRPLSIFFYIRIGKVPEYFCGL